MTRIMAKHGSEAGYKAELGTGNICERCRSAHREYNRQFTKTGKAGGLRYDRQEVIDHLARPPRPGVPGGGTRARQGTPGGAPVTVAVTTSAGRPVEPEGAPAATGDRGPRDASRLEGLMRDRLTAVMTPVHVEEEPPDYLRPVEPDPEPSGEWSEVKTEEFVINAAQLKTIEENMGTYLSVVGMTVEMIDPYCGPILADNFDNIVSKWTKVVSHYPKAAQLFLDSKGGTVFAWIGALQATWPFLYALYEHHLSRTIQTRDGIVYRRNGDGTSVPDATTPPMPESFAYSAA